MFFDFKDKMVFFVKKIWFFLNKIKFGV